MNIKSQKGYSVLEIGVGLIIISIFMVCSVTMLKGTYENYRLVEQNNLAISYAIKGVERELLKGSRVIEITEDPLDTVETREGNKEISVTKIDANNMTLTTIVEPLPEKNGKSYETSKVKLVTSSVEYYLKKNDESTKKILELQTLKIGGWEVCLIIEV